MARRPKPEVVPPPSNTIARRKVVWGAPPPTGALHDAIEWTRTLSVPERKRAIISSRGAQVVVALQGTDVRMLFH